MMLNNSLFSSWNTFVLVNSLTSPELASSFETSKKLVEFAPAIWYKEEGKSLKLYKTGRWLYTVVIVLGS